MKKILALLAAAGAVLFFWRKKKQEEETPAWSSEPSPAEPSTTDVTGSSEGSSETT